MSIDEVLVKVYGVVLAAFLIMASLISKYLFKSYKEFNDKINRIDENTQDIPSIKKDIEEFKEQKEQEELKKQLRKEIRNELNNEHKRL